MTTIGTEEVYQLITHRKPAMLLDVREPVEYIAGHIPGSVNLPLSRFTIQAPDLPRDVLIVTICEHGSRSEVARRLLAQKGYTVKSMGGGMSMWRWATVRGRS